MRVLSKIFNVIIYFQKKKPDLRLIAAVIGAVLEVYDAYTVSKMDLIRTGVEIILSYLELRDRDRLMEEIFAAFRESQERSRSNRRIEQDTDNSQMDTDNNHVNRDAVP